MQKNTHEKKLNILFTQIDKGIHYDSFSDILTKYKAFITHSSIILTLTGTFLGYTKPNGGLKPFG